MCFRSNRKNDIDIEFISNFTLIEFTESASSSSVSMITEIQNFIIV